MVHELLTSHSKRVSDVRIACSHVVLEVVGTLYAVDEQDVVGNLVNEFLVTLALCRTFNKSLTVCFEHLYFEEIIFPANVSVGIFQIGQFHNRWHVAGVLTLAFRCWVKSNGTFAVVSHEIAD